jgi:hypothetical protein
MTLTRLLVAALFFCSVPAFAQDQQPLKQRTFKQSELARGTWFFLKSDAAATPGEPWRIGLNRPADATAGTNPMDRLQLDKFKVYRSKTDTRTFLLGPEADAGMVLSSLDGPDGVITCLKIRSYVVARDSKDSDSTHPVSYSTCQPSNRYRVKSAEMRVGAESR